MQFLIGLSVERHIDHHRLEKAGNGGGRAQDLADQFESAGVTARGDGADVPDHRLLGIEVRRADQKQPSLSILRGNRRHHGRVEEARDRVRQRRGVGERVAEDAAEEAAVDIDILARDGRVDLAKLRIVSGSKERERRDQGARADTGDDIELRPTAGFGPSDEKARAKRAVIAAAGNGEEVGGWKRSVRRKAQGLPLPLNCARSFGNDVVPLLGRKEPCIRKSQRLSLGRLGRRHGRQTRERRTGRHDEDNKERGNPRKQRRNGNGSTVHVALKCSTTPQAVLLACSAGASWT